MRMRLLAIRTRGDVQPYVALGLRLKCAGFGVSIAATADFRPFVESYGIVRLHGHGRVHEHGTETYEELRPRFPDFPGERAIIDVAVSRVASSCGFGVRRMELLGPREQLLASAERKGPEKLAGYRARKNERSIDRLPGLESATPSRHDENQASREGDT